MVGQDQSLCLLLVQSYWTTGAGLARESGLKFSDEEAKVGCLTAQRQDGLQRATESRHSQDTVKTRISALSWQMVYLKGPCDSTDKC